MGEEKKKIWTLPDISYSFGAPAEVGRRPPARGLHAVAELAHNGPVRAQEGPDHEPLHDRGRRPGALVNAAPHRCRVSVFTKTGAGWRQMAELTGQ